MVNIKKELRYLDWAVFAIVILAIGTHMCTNYYIAKKVEVTKADIESVVQAYEANPLIKWILVIKHLNIIMMLLIKPAFLITIYWMFRRLVKTEIQLFALQTFVIFFLAVVTINFLNDFSLLLGMMAR